MNPVKALAIMALPTVGSQMVVLVYNIADTWFIGRTDDPAMIAASNLALTVLTIAEISGHSIIRIRVIKDPSGFI